MYNHQLVTAGKLYVDRFPVTALLEHSTVLRVNLTVIKRGRRKISFTVSMGEQHVVVLQF